MSRLDSAIRRLKAQRDCLGLAAEIIGNASGIVFELGLGNGRTYDHLRSLMPHREIFVFDRQVAAHPGSVPNLAHTVLGNFSDTLPSALKQFGQTVVFAHCDTGSGDVLETKKLAEWLGPALDPMLVPGAVIASDQGLCAEGWEKVKIPESVPLGRYHMYQKH